MEMGLSENRQPLFSYFFWMASNFLSFKRVRNSADEISRNPKSAESSSAVIGCFLVNRKFFFMMVSSFDVCVVSLIIVISSLWKNGQKRIPV